MTPGTLTASDGTPIVYERWGGADGSALFVHATGLCKEMWRPVRRALEAMGVDLGGLAFDQRAHGDSGRPEPPFRWSALGRDAAGAVEVLDRPLLGVGHSSGGAALCMAEAALPGTFSALVLIEPIVFPGPFRRMEDNPFTAGALRRRSSFASRREARANFEERGPFARWTVEALDTYVEHAFRDVEGQRVLKCSPEDEAEFYREGTNHDTWERLPSIRCPVVVVSGGDSNSHPAGFVELLAARFPDATIVAADGATHFVPMEQPEVVAASIAVLVG